VHDDFERLRVETEEERRHLLDTVSGTSPPDLA
jgi:hypothetical protein